MDHLVSVIVPVHNGERFLAEAVESIRQQAYPSLEIMIVDDGSTDGTAQVIACLGRDVRPVYQPQRGPAAARNHGLDLSRGDFIAFLDCDDLWPAGKLHLQVQRLLDDPALDVVLGRIQPIRAGGEPLAARDAPDPVIDVQLGCAVFRRRVFESVGLFDPGLTFSEDYDWFLRARDQAVRLAVMDQVTLLHRRHSGNMTRVQDHRGYQLPRVLKASLDRRRARGDGSTQSHAKLLASDPVRVAPDEGAPAGGN